MAHSGRRRFLAATAALAAAPLARAAGPAARAVVVGGGWGGLSAAATLRRLAPDIDVVLIERQTEFRSAPLSNHWLSGRVGESLLRHDYSKAAAWHGYRFLQGDVQDIDRTRRTVATAAETTGYDWLVLAAGIRQDYSAWFGGDSRAAVHAAERYPGAFLAEELPRLKRKVDDFRGGVLLMTIPPMPYRCPPAPYERACVIAELLRSRKIPGRLVVVDPNAGMPVFTRIFRDRYRDQITYLPQARVRSVDPFARTLATDFDDIRFDDALLAPPQQAAELIWRSGLIGTTASGQPTGWANQDPLALTAAGDERVLVIGDAMGAVSPVFGHYPKTGHLASHLGRIAATRIVAGVRGIQAPAALPESICHVATGTAPLELLRIDARYRLRGDGVIVQTVEQKPDPNPRDEDLAWARDMFGALFG